MGGAYLYCHVEALADVADLRLELICVCLVRSFLTPHEQETLFWATIANDKARLWKGGDQHLRSCTAQTRQRLFFSICDHNSSSFAIENNWVRPHPPERSSKIGIWIEKFRCHNSNLNLPTIKKRFLRLFVSLGSVTYRETDLSTVLESLSYTSHVGMLG